MISTAFKRTLGFVSFAILASLFVNPIVVAMDDPMEEDNQQGQKRKLEDSSTQRPKKRLKALPAKSLSDELFELVNQHMGKDKQQFCLFTKLYQTQKELLFDIFFLVSDDYHGISLVNKAFCYTARFTRTSFEWSPGDYSEVKEGFLDPKVLLYPNLTTLDLSDNEGISNDALSKLQNLTFLDLTDNDNISDQGISSLTKLKELILNSESNTTANGKITNASLSLLTKLENLSLFGNLYITDQGVTTLTNLNSVDLSFNHAIDGPCLSLLTNLKSLLLVSNNHIRNAHISPLTRIENLDLSDNTNIAFEAIQNFTKLKKLDIAPGVDGSPLIMSDEEQRILKLNNPGLEIITEYKPILDQEMDTDTEMDTDIDTGNN